MASLSGGCVGSPSAITVHNVNMRQCPLCTQASLSSVPLCVGELFSAAGLEALVEASKPPFVLLFLLLRTAYWPYVSAGFWQDSLWALAKPRDRAHSLVAYAALLGANVFLTGLQVFWTGQICAAVGEALGQQ